MKKAVENNQTDAMALLGYIYHYNHGWYSDARDIWTVGTQNGNLDCQVRLAEYYWADNNYQKEIELYIDAANKGSDKAKEWVKNNSEWIKKYK